MEIILEIALRDLHIDWKEVEVVVTRVYIIPSEHQHFPVDKVSSVSASRMRQLPKYFRVLPS